MTSSLFDLSNKVAVVTGAAQGMGRAMSMALAEAKKVYVEDLRVAILDRPRHEKLINEVRRAGAGIKLISAGDLSAAIATTRPESEIDMLIGVGGGRRGRRVGGMFVMATLFALLLLLPACSKSSTQAPVSGTPAGNYTITVSATSGNDTKSQSITLTVP